MPVLNAGFDLPLGTSLSDTIQNWQHNGATGTYRPTRAQYPTPLEVCFNSQPCSLNHPLFSPPAVLLALHSLPACFPHLLFFTSHTCFSLELPHILSFFFFFFALSFEASSVLEHGLFGQEHCSFPTDSKPHPKPRHRVFPLLCGRAPCRWLLFPVIDRCHHNVPKQPGAVAATCGVVWCLCAKRVTR